MNPTQELFAKNASVARLAAQEGAVLLQNDGILPFADTSVVAPLGKGCFELVKGGTGSADVFTAYTRQIIDGLQEKQAEGKLRLSQKALALRGAEAYTDAVLAEIATEANVALVNLTRLAGEGGDRTPRAGDFYLSEAEKSLFSQIQACDGFTNCVVLLNIPAVIDLGWLKDYPKISAVLVTWVAGQEAGLAVSDLLCADACPTGRLCTTFADYYAYPSAESFLASDTYLRYEEDIFVGYRCFETFERAKAQVQFPFGYGLSYTEFAWEQPTFSKKEDILSVSVTVKNIGNFQGKEVVQCYVSSPNGALVKPKLELKGYAKTASLQPSEAQTVTIEFPLSDLASFDDCGASGHLGAFVLEQGEYTVYLGKNVRDLTECGRFTLAQTTVMAQHSLKLTAPLDRKLCAPDRTDGYAVGVSAKAPATPIGYHPIEKPIRLCEVAKGEATLDSFIAQMTDTELIDLCYAQPPALTRGTAGIGNNRRLGIPNAQTADGPCGIRRTVPTTCFPCPTAIGCTWDAQLQYEVGRAIGEEGAKIGVDILLAPGLNIQRNPLCGRNFEYFSEDPLVSGRAAAAFVRGVQSTSVCATIKHFAANNKEKNRFYSNSLVSERALREIYLKGFEIAIAESNPAFVMTSYNYLNGVRTNENRNLLQGILRDEWHYEGAIMTDWRVPSHQWSELRGGNNVKMPFGYPEEHELTQQMLARGVITRAELEESARYVLLATMKTLRFAKQDMGRKSAVGSNTIIRAVDFTEIATTWNGEEPCRDIGGGNNMCLLGKGMKGEDCYLTYLLEVEEAGDYTLALRAATKFETSYIEVFVDDRKVGECGRINTGGWQNWETWEVKDIPLPKGECVLKVLITTREPDQGINLNWLRLQKQ